MAKISKPAYNVSADVSPSVVPDGAGSVHPDVIVDAEPVAPNLYEAIALFLDHMRDGIPDLGLMHGTAEGLSRAASQISDHANSAKLSRIGNAIAEMRNGLISALS